MIIQVSKIRLNGSVSAKKLSDDYRVVNTHKKLCVTLPEALRGVVQEGSVWEVHGSMSEISYEVKNFTIYEEQLQATSAKMLRPKTSLMEHWLQKNIDGIGSVKAQRLARNPNLIEFIDAQDYTALKALGLTELTVSQLIRKFPNDQLLQVINWLSERNLPVKVANVIVDTWQTNAVKYLEENPFRLMSLGVSFKQVCSVAEAFGFTTQHTIYKAALIVNMLQEYCNRSSSTVMPKIALQKACDAKRLDMADLLQKAAQQELICAVEGGYQLEGQFLLEALTANSFRNAFFRKDGDGCHTAAWEKGITDKAISKQINEYQSTISYSLTDDQKEAIFKACRFKVFSISGGAGTGKTTILKGVLSVLEKLSLGVPIIQLALSGRASQRMAQATGLEASTIAKFCSDMKGKKPAKRPTHAVCIIDEASMVDLTSMHNALKYLPAATRFIFVGDVDQLPPVGSGLIFHNLMKSDFPHHTLTKVKRQSEDSGIHKLATAVRNQEDSIKIPVFYQNKDADCTIMRSTKPETIIGLANQFDKSETVILTAMQNGQSGVKNLNKMMQADVGFDRDTVKIKTEDYEPIDFITSKGNKLYLNDPIIITKNAYDADVRNGDLGVITQVYENPFENNYGTILINGRELKITDELLDKIELGYAMTIHKSQGSQWKNVILVLDKRAERMLDKTLVYTGITRAEQKLIMCAEDINVVQNAANRGSIAVQRHTNLLAHLHTDF